MTKVKPGTPTTPPPKPKKVTRKAVPKASPGKPTTPPPAAPKSRGKTISPSQLDAMGCRLAWWLGYKQGWRAKRSALPLEFGTGIHYGLERYYGHQEDPADAFDKWVTNRVHEIDPRWSDDVDRLEEKRDLGIEMLKGYVQEYEGKEEFNVLHTEIMLRRPLPDFQTGEDTDIDVVVRLDGLVRDRRNGLLFSLEHKTFEQFRPTDLDRNHQFVAQAWVAQALAQQIGIDEEVSGVIYNGLRKQMPGPRVRSRLFERHRIFANQRQIDVFLHRAYWQYKEFYIKDLPVYPQPSGPRCGMCDYTEVCMSYHTGGDWKFILENLFERRKA